MQLQHTDPSSSDDGIATVPTANGGMRRKHHRIWTLNEVVKLVEGVARYGVGRWSEIKRVFFASHSHRTSVDLKVCLVVRSMNCKTIFQYFFIETSGWLAVGYSTVCVVF